MTTARSFWAWHRTGLASAVSGAPADGGSRAHLPARITLDATHERDVPVDLLGPGDVTGLDPTEVVRSEPADGSTGFPPAELPYVELRHADLPWRFSPVGPVTGTLTDPEHPGVSAPSSRLQPWLALVVVPSDAATVTRGADGSATLACQANLLPDLREAWAWAHVQLTADAIGDPGAALSDPEQSIARLVCPIHLEADQHYVAAIVPTYAAGAAAAGLPLPPTAQPLDPAWGPTGPVTLPAYRTWSFETGNAGTFESLARRLRPRAAPESANGIPLRIDAPGWGASAPAGQTVLIQGALRPLAATSEPPADAPFAASLAAALSSTGTGLQLRPPLYGQDHAAGATTVAAGAKGWFSQLNTDARRRFAAGLAMWAVAVEQEDLCDRAWQQLADAGVSADTSRADVASAVLGAIGTRHATTSPATASLGPSSVMARMLRPGGSLARLGFGASSPLNGAATTTALLARASAAAVATAPISEGAETFSPTFADAALQALQSTAPEWLLPGMADLPEDSIVLMRTNPAFVEAFLVGLNHAMARELQWRRYPLDQTGTMFATFWPATPGAPRTAITPISAWDPASDLGSHVGTGGTVVLLLRGALLRRFPNTTVYLSGQEAGGLEQVVRPTIEAYAGADTTLVGFPMNAEQILNPSTPGLTWSVVLQESVLHPRFGVDDAPPGGGSATLRTWQDLDWGHPQLAGSLHIRVVDALAGVEALAGVGRPTGPTTPLGTPPTARWAADSAAMSAALTRAPVRVRIPASLWLTATGS